MRSESKSFPVRELCDLWKKRLLLVNPEYQRGLVWADRQKRMLIDSMMRGYPLPLIYSHHKRLESAGLTSEGLEIIDGQQRINAIYEYAENAFPLFDPKKDKAARFPRFISEQRCEWGGMRFKDLPDLLRDSLVSIRINAVVITTENENEARDLFIRLQSGEDSQYKRHGRSRTPVKASPGRPNVTVFPLMSPWKAK